MEDTEIHLRVKQIVERVQIVKASLNEICKLLETASVQKTRNFVGPNEIIGNEKHWKNYCVSSRRQLYGLNQKIMMMKRIQQSTGIMDIGLLRLISQASLNSSQLLKGLLQFPSKLQSKSEQKDSIDIIAKIVAASKQLLLLLQQLGFASQINKEPGQGGGDVSSTSIEEVESSVVEELLERGTAAKHLARMARLRLHSNERSAPAAKSVLLPRGRRMLLVEDSLSHLISSQKPSGRTSKIGARSSSAGGVLSVPSKVRHAQPRSSRRRRRKHRHRSLSEQRSSRPRRRESEARDQDEAQRHQLWQQLLPLLLNQEVLELNSPDIDWPRRLQQLDDILESLESMQLNAEYNFSFRNECERLEVGADRSDDSLDDAIHKARNLLQKSGFLPPDSLGTNVHAYDEDESNLTASNEESGEENIARNTDVFSDIRRRKESFWASLAKEGYVGS